MKEFLQSQALKNFLKSRTVLNLRFFVMYYIMWKVFSFELMVCTGIAGASADVAYNEYKK